VEERLGVRLFNRTTRKVSLTEAGELFVASIAPAVAGIRGAIDAAASSRRSSLSGTIRIKTSGDAAREIITPIILQFLRRYPEMKIDVVANGPLSDFVGEGFDAGVRGADDVPQDMIAVPLSHDLRMAVVGSLAYFENRQKPRTPQDLLVHRCIRLRSPGGGINSWRFERHGKVVSIKVEGPLILDEPAFILDAARAGVGLAYLRESIVASDLANGRLVRVLEDWTHHFPGICFCYSPRTRFR
jgi:DNA-binding transcriptional LysR family regulator